MAQDRPAPLPWNLPPSLPKKKAKDFHVTCLSPSSVVYNKKEPVVIVFNQSLPSNVEFTIKFFGQQTNNETQCYAQKIGDNVLTFRAPEHYPPEDVILSVYHGKYLTKLCDCTAFSFTSFLQQVRDQLMHVSDPVEFMCAALHLKQKNIVALDFEFEKQFKKNIHPNFDLIADKHPRKIDESSTFEEYPTLLHFAARYNLIKLCIAILKCHGGYSALNIRNKDGFTPSELASEHGHDNLAYVLGNAQQHQNITVEPSDIYESSHDPIYESYVRVVGEATDEEIYVTMDHGNEDDIYEAMVGHGYEDDIYQNSGHFFAAYADTTSLASVSSTSSSGYSGSSTTSGRFGYRLFGSQESLYQAFVRLSRAEIPQIIPDVTPFAIPTNDAQVTQLAFIRSEKKIISNHGAIMELYITGITLEVPESALEDDTVVLLGTLDPSAIPKVPTDVGEEVLSDIIIVGPAEARFNMPAILSIPHSLTEIPKHSSICIQQFGFGTNKWERLPLSSDLHKLDTNRGYITRPGLYALCLCLDAELHFIPRTSTLIRPFNEENGVAITFAENTFGNDETNVEFKLNTLTERMYEGFKSAGIKPSVILHINAANNDQPKKPVSIAMPIPKDVNQDENIRIFQCDHGDDFTDVTGKISFKIKEYCVILRVDHFTKYWIFGTSIEVPDFAPLLNFFYPIYDVCFSVYVKDESIRVGCCEWNARKVMHNEMTSFTYTKVDFIKGKLRNRDTSTIAMHGRYKISGNANGVQLIFNANEIEYTNSLYLEASESSKETPSSLKNEVIISIDMERARDPVLLKFLKEDDSANQYPHQPLVTKNKRNLSSDKEDRDSIATTKDLLLLDLCEDYSFMLELESKLEDTSTNNIKDLLLILELSYEDRCKILESATSSLAFFENLSKSKPHLSLHELKASIEKVTSKAQPNMTIFMKIEKDIANGLVCFTLDTTLEGLSNNPKDWLYVLETIAGNLNPKEGTLLKSWRDIAGDHGYKSSEILGFQRRNKEESPIRKLFSLLCARTPSFTVCSLVEKLKQMRREDVAIMVERWQDDTVKYRNNLREAKKLASEEE